MEPLSYGGTFTLERVLGTVPVEEDGSAYFEVPARRSVFFVALDEDGKAVKRMQSFTSVEPGEVLGCVGCHEHRTHAPPAARSPSPAGRAAARRARSRRSTDVPDVFDFPRDIQPILDRHCVECHRTDQAGRRRHPDRRPRADVLPQLLLADRHEPVRRRPQPRRRATTRPAPSAAGRAPLAEEVRGQPLRRAGRPRGRC